MTMTNDHDHYTAVKKVMVKGQSRQTEKRKSKQKNNKKTDMR